MFDTPMTRRAALRGTMALAANLLGGRGIAAQSSTPASSNGWETHAGAPGELRVAWDPARWALLDEPDPDRDAIWLVDTESGPEAMSGQNFLGASHSPLPWTTLPEVEANALNYRFPTNTPTVIGTWTTGNATGFASVGGDADAMGFNYLEFSTLDLAGIWRDIVISMPVAAFDADRARELYRSVIVDGQTIPRATDLDAVIEVFAKNAQPEE